MMAGAGGAGGPADNTGVSQDAHMQLLTAMEDNGWTGSIIPGVPGTGKTLFAKSIGKAHGVPLIKVDLGGMKKEHVGSSEQRIREALRTVKSIGDGRVVVLATCNRIEALSPEFRRRFRMPTFYFDTPTVDEGAVLWRHYLDVYGVGPTLGAAELAARFVGWTGAEVRNACELAHNLGMPVIEAASYIVPLVVSAPESIETLRKQADGRWLSASTGKLYRKTSDEPGQRTGRRIAV
jgi:SpoVK/Ycf46/Vps4 family AAA+-type ATPase